jgi:hypothetical protein
VKRRLPHRRRGLSRHGTPAARVRRLAVDYVLAPVWRSLVAYGSVFVSAAENRPWPDEPWPEEPLPAARLYGLPPGHPERMCPHVPLSEAELLLVRELWPGYQGERRGPTWT